MKKVIYLLLSLAFLLPGYAEAKTQLEKARDAAYKTKLKDYKKNKWEALGSRPIEYCLAAHYEKLNALGENGHEVEGISTRSQSKNIGKQAAINNAVITYGQEAGSTLQGRVISDMSANSVNTDGEFDNFFAAYERLVEKEIRGEMEPSYTIIRDNGDGTYEVRTYFIVEESSAQKARLRALEEALKNSEVASQYAEKIADFVREGFQE